MQAFFYDGKYYMFAVEDNSLENVQRLFKLHDTREVLWLDETNSYAPIFLTENVKKVSLKIKDILEIYPCEIELLNNINFKPETTVPLEKNYGEAVFEIFKKLESENVVTLIKHKNIPLLIEELQSIFEKLMPLYFFVEIKHNKAFLYLANFLNYSIGQEALDYIINKAKLTKLKHWTILPPKTKRVFNKWLKSVKCERQIDGKKFTYKLLNIDNSFLPTLIVNTSIDRYENLTLNEIEKVTMFLYKLINQKHFQSIADTLIVSNGEDFWKESKLKKELKKNTQNNWNSFFKKTYFQLTKKWDGIGKDLREDILLIETTNLSTLLFGFESNYTTNAKAIGIKLYSLYFDINETFKVNPLKYIMLRDKFLKLFAKEKETLHAYNFFGFACGVNRLYLDFLVFDDSLFKELLHRIAPILGFHGAKLIEYTDDNKIYKIGNGFR